MKTTKSITSFPWVGLKILAPVVFILLAGCGGGGGGSTTTDDEPTESASPPTPLIAGGFTVTQNTVLEISGTVIVKNSHDGTDGITEKFAVESNTSGLRSPTGYIIAKNDGGNATNPGLYSVFDWATNGTALYLCHSAADKQSLADAEAVPFPDTTNPTVSGCGSGNGPWLAVMRDPLPIQGAFNDGFAAHSISQTLWTQGTSNFHHLEIDTSQQFLLAKNDPANVFNPGLYSRFDWVIFNDVFYYCQTAYNAATPTIARNVTPPNATDPSAVGCGLPDFNFPWTAMGALVNIYANRVVDYSPVNSLDATPADWPYFFQPDAILGEVGDFTNVVSLGFDPAATNAKGGNITVGLGLTDGSTDARCVVDGPGADFVVFENPFRTGDIGDGSQGTYTEVATVEVSADGAQWYPFPTAIDGAKALEDPARYSNLAGVIPVDEGGDSFDLAEVIIANPGVLDANFRACFIRARDGGTLIDDYGNSQSDLYNSGADINAIQAIHSETVVGLSQ